jgi:serine/threonine protein kinase
MEKYSLLSTLQLSPSSSLFTLSHNSSKFFCKKLPVPAFPVLCQSYLQRFSELSQISHPSVLKYCECVADETSLSLVTELCEEGDVRAWLVRCRAQQERLAEDVVWQAVAQLAAAVCACHSHELAHGNIRPSAVLASASGLKLGGFAMPVPRTANRYYSMPRTENSSKADFANDVWALGCLIIELTTLRKPFDGSEDVGNEEIKAAIRSVPDWYSERVRKVAEQVLARDYRLRPTAAQLLLLIGSGPGDAAFGVDRALNEGRKTESNQSPPSRAGLPLLEKPAVVAFVNSPTANKLEKKEHPPPEDSTPGDKSGEKNVSAKVKPDTPSRRADSTGRYIKNSPDNFRKRQDHSRESPRYAEPVRKNTSREPGAYRRESPLVKVDPRRLNFEEAYERFGSAGRGKANESQMKEPNTATDILINSPIDKMIMRKTSEGEIDEKKRAEMGKGGEEEKKKAAGMMKPPSRRHK